jgi:transcriptional regulator with XRE-family HTH domain
MVKIPNQEIAAYTDARQKALKRIVRQMREEANLSQGDVAQFLGCSRTRITEIEQEKSGTEYSIGEMELLAVLFGRHPLDVLKMTGQEGISVGEIVTSNQTGKALLLVVDCLLPKRIVKVLRDSNASPSELVFSLDGSVLATIADAYVGEDWQEDEPFQFTILCWDAHSGQLTGQIRRPYVTHIVPVNSGQVVILRDTAHGRAHIEGKHDYESDLLIWDVPGETIQKKIKLPERAQNLTISPDGNYVAVYMAATTTIQVWQTATWEPVCAFELDIMHWTSHHPGEAVHVAREVGQLPQERKFGLWHMTYRPRSFDFLQNDILIVEFTDLTVELEVGPSSRGKAIPPIDEPRFGCHPVVYARNQNRRIAVLDVVHDQYSGNSLVSLYYQVPKEREYSSDPYIEWAKMCPGEVFQPIILDDACILAWTAFNTPYRREMFHKQRVGLLNLVSGRLAMLTDGNRLRRGDDQQSASLSPHGNAIAYWVYPVEGAPRPSIQYFDTAPLQAKGVTLVAALDRERRREEEW